MFDQDCSESDSSSEKGRVISLSEKRIPSIRKEISGGIPDRPRILSSENKPKDEKITVTNRKYSNIVVKSQML